MEQFIKQIIKGAGAEVMKRYKKVGVKYSKKFVGDIVTEADLVSNEYLVGQIKKKYPNHGIISEESESEHLEAEYLWIIDPLDGTRNFSTHTPLFGVMIGLARNKIIEMGALYDPLHDELLFAEKSKGTYLNGERVYCSKMSDLENSYGVIGLSDSSSDSIEIKKKLYARFENTNTWISAVHSSCYAALQVATGRRDWRVAGKMGGVWDFAAPVIIMREAGCVVTTVEGKEWALGDNSLVAANFTLHKQLLEAICKDSNSALK